MESAVTGWKRFAIEPVMFALTFGWSMSGNVITDLTNYQTCRTIPGLIANASSCSILHANSSSAEAMRLEKLVQPYAGPILAARSCLDQLFPMLLIAFLGPWSDRHGRKPLLVFPIVGEVSRYAGYAILSAIDLGDSYFLLLPSAPIALLGGGRVSGLACYCYVADVTDAPSRSWHLSRLVTAFLAGTLLGILAGPAIFETWGYVAVFATSASVHFLALVWSVMVVEESRLADGTPTIKSVFDLSLVRELLNSVIEPRDGFDRFVVWSCFCYLAMFQIHEEGALSVSFLFASSHLGWDLVDYSAYYGVHVVVYILGMLLLVRVFGSIFKLSDIGIVMTSCLSIAASSAARAFVTRPWQMYLMAVVGMFVASSTPLINSVLSKTVPQSDIGKIFSLTTVIDLLVPMATSPLYIFVYTRTLNVYPCPVWFLSVPVALAMMVLAVMIKVRWERFENARYNQLEPVENG